MEGKISEKESNNKTSTMKKFQCCTINRPLIPLKLALFCWYGAGAFMPSFLTLLLKQRGVTLSELSTMTIFAPIVQVLGTAVSGVVADKLGRSKPVLVANVLLVISIVTGILLMPQLHHKRPVHPPFTNSCHSEDPSNPVLQTSCDSARVLEAQNHSMFCSSNLTNNGGEKNRIPCWKNMTDTDERNLSFRFYLNNNTYLNRTGDKCFYSIDAINYQKFNNSLCNEVPEISCVECCNDDSDCSEENGSSTSLLMAYGVLYILYLTTYSNTYRCFDITVMSLVKEYNSDFGHERFFSILGNMCWSPLAGLLSHATSPEGGVKNYTTPIYLFLSVSCFLLFIIYKLPVVMTTPGDKMWKKSFKLLKNIDVLMFLITIFSLGTCFNFTKYYTFWYLEDLNASSLLIGLIPSVGALYGLPFLLTSKWWVKKMGTHQIFIASLLAYMASALGYSFLKNPWISLVLELHGAISYYLLWVAVVEHSNSIATEGLTSTVIAVAGAIHYSAGKSASGLIGRMVMNEYGAVVAFRLIAVLCTTVAVLYTTFLCFRRKYVAKKHQIDQKGGSKENIKACVVFTLDEKK